MPSDNTQLSVRVGDGDIIATDVITTLNGSSDSTGEKAQRVKVGWGVDGTFNDTNATNPLPVVQTGTPTLPSGAATSAKQDSQTTLLGGGLPSALATDRLKVDGSGVTQPVSAASLPLPSGAATETTLGGVLTTSDFDTKVGSLTETAPATDTASSGLNGRLQRIAQRLTSMIALLPSALGSGGGLKVDGSGTALPVSGTVTVTGVATETTLGTRLSESDFDTKTGSLTETAPATDTASSGLNGRLQRIAQRITSLITALGSPFQVGGALGAGSAIIGKVGIDQTTPGTTNLVAASNLPTTVDTNSGSKSASTLRVVLATDQPALTNKLLVTPDANSAVNIAQMNGVTTSMGVGASDTGTQRIVQANGAGKTIASAGGSASSSGNNTLVAAGTNKLKVFAFSLSTLSTTAVTCIFQSGASGTELWRVVLQAPTGPVNVGANLAVSPPAWLFATASATLLNLNLSSANAVHWSVSYFDES